MVKKDVVIADYPASLEGAMFKKYVCGKYQPVCWLGMERYYPAGRGEVLWRSLRLWSKI